MNNNMSMLINMLRGGINPQQAIQNIAMNNPNVQQIMNQVKSSGMSMEQFARNYAKQHNINIQDVINMFNQNGIKL